VTDERIVRWTRWVEGPIRANVLNMFLQRDAWLTVSQVIEGNGQLPHSYWWEFMFDTYSTTQAIAVRRQADLRSDVASLGRLINEIHANADVLTLAFWLDLWGVTAAPTSFQERLDRSEAERQWTEHFARGTGEHLDPAIPADDAETLKTAAANVRHYVNKHVAHTDEVESVSAAQVAISLDDVHEAIDTIGDLFRRYYSLLTCSGFTTLVPVIQDDWLAIFREPWMRDGARVRD
jgi:AbiU2